MQCRPVLNDRGRIGIRALCPLALCPLSLAGILGWPAFTPSPALYLGLATVVPQVASLSLSFLRCSFSRRSLSTGLLYSGERLATATANTPRPVFSPLVPASPKQ